MDSQVSAREGLVLGEGRDGLALEMQGGESRSECRVAGWFWEVL